jgi:GAF domain-containing protein
MVTPPDETTADPHAVIAELRAERDAGLAREATLAEELATSNAALAQRNTDFDERIEYQAATIDVLKTMSASPGDAQPVFDLIVRRATELCNVPSATLFEYDGELVHIRSDHRSETVLAPGALAAYVQLFPMRPTRGSISCRAILDRQIIHVRDLRLDRELAGFTSELGHRSQVSVPLIRDDHAIGVITIGAQPPGGFSDSQIELLKTFAEQAVIAINSAKTYRALQTRTSDLQETLEYQTAISDVLRVISRSTFDLQPVLDTLVETAARLCDADQAVIARPEGDLWRLRANFGFPPEYEAYQRERGLYSLDPRAPNVSARAVRGRRPVHIHDVAEVPGYPEIFIRLAKQRSSLGVPLLREGEAIGYIVLARQRVEPFTDRQIELVSTFADQAVIAIENTRLMTEQREALEQQTATAEVLQVINSSPGDLVPVFQAILGKAHSLCGVARGSLELYDGHTFRAVATHGLAASFADELKKGYAAFDNPATLPLIEGEPFTQILDITQHQFPFTRGADDALGARTLLCVPLRRDGKLLGMIASGRLEVQPFTEKQITLLQNFAAQAVIAMENARLITETREALEQQTATAEVLQVINSSPGELAPVFQALLQKAHTLCEASFGALMTESGFMLRRTTAVPRHSGNFSDREFVRAEETRSGS